MYETIKSVVTAHVIDMRIAVFLLGTANAVLNLAILYTLIRYYKVWENMLKRQTRRDDQ